MEVVLEPVAGEEPASFRLVRASIAGDRGAFAALVEPHLATALGAAVVLTRSHADAADAVQDALLSAWQGLDRLRDPVAFPAWFRTHVIRAALRHAGRRSGMPDGAAGSGSWTSPVRPGRRPGTPWSAWPSTGSWPAPSTAWTSTTGRC